MAFIHQPKLLHKFARKKKGKVEEGRKIIGDGLQGGKEMVHKKKDACNR